MNIHLILLILFLAWQLLLQDVTVRQCGCISVGRSKSLFRWKLL